MSNEMKEVNKTTNSIKEDKKPIFTGSTVSLLLFNTILTGLNLYCLLGLIPNRTTWVILSAVGCALLFAMSLLFLFLRLNMWQKVVFIGIVICSAVVWIYYLIKILNLGEIFSSVEALREAVASTGTWGMVIFVLIQFAQVLIAPIPAVVSTLAGALMFGPLVGALLSLVGILMGSLVAFSIGKFLGEKVVSWVIGKENTQKYSKLFYEKGKFVFFLMMLFPVFPDDLLCMVAGMTTMKFRFFITSILLTRPIGIFMTCYLGSGDIIPYHGWGLIVWGVLIVIMAVLFFVAYKYQEQIEKGLIKFGEKVKSLFRKPSKIKLNAEARQPELDGEAKPTSDDSTEQKDNTSASEDSTKAEKPAESELNIDDPFMDATSGVTEPTPAKSGEVTKKRTAGAKKSTTSKSKPSNTKK